GAEPLALGGGGLVEPSVQVNEAARGDEPWQEALPPPGASNGGRERGGAALRRGPRRARRGIHGRGSCPPPATSGTSSPWRRGRRLARPRRSPAPASRRRPGCRS